MPKQRRCSRCGTNYEAIDELHKGGHCPSCGSYLYEPAVVSEYKMAEKPEPDPPEPDDIPEPDGSPDEFDGPLPGSTADYLNE